MINFARYIDIILCNLRFTLSFLITSICIYILTLSIILEVSDLSTAGEWKKLAPSGGRDCTIQFSGEINPGDLRKAIETNLIDEYNAVLCLNSQGGSLSEVLTFISDMEKKESLFATRIRQDEQCLSACAILFMFGKGMGANSPYIDRVMEPHAKLGFHSPFLPKAMLDKAGGDAIYNTALAVSKLLVDRSYKAETTEGPALPVELTSIILSTPSSDMYYVKTIGEMALLNIGSTTGIVEGGGRWGESIANISGITNAQVKMLMKRICASSYILTFKNHFIESQYNFDDLVRNVGKYYNDTYDFELFERNKISGIVGVLVGPLYEPGWHSAGAQMYCKVNIRTSKNRDVENVDSYDVSFGNWNLDADNNARNIQDGPGRFKVIKSGLLPIETLY